jgi:hypothetical protein
VSQSEGGFEGVYQSSAVLPRWIVSAGPDRSWSVTITLAADRVGAVAPGRTAVASTPAGNLATAAT